MAPVTPVELGKAPQDWRTVSTKRVVDGYSVLTIPKGTLLYKGVGIIRKKGFNMRHGKYYGTLPTASIYAFQLNHGASLGKIIVYKTTKDINILDMEEKSTYNQLHSKFGDIVYKKLKTPFGFSKGKNHLKRKSWVDKNKAAVSWMCKSLPRSIIGYGYKKMPGPFHEEIMLCGDTKNQPLQKLTKEYRYVPYYDRNHILETQNGKFNGHKIKISNVKVNYPNKADGVLKPKGHPSNAVNLFYKNTFTPKYNQFLLEPPIKNSTISYLNGASVNKNNLISWK